MKIKSFLFFSLFSLLVTSFISCNNSSLPEDAAYVSISFDDIYARTIKPDIDYTNISDIELTAQRENAEPVVLGTWNSKEAAINKPIQLEIGEYTFVITAQVNGAELSDSIIKTVVPGNNNLDFKLQLTSYANEGTGSLDVKIYFPDLRDLYKVEALFKKYSETQTVSPVPLAVNDADGENLGKKYINFSRVNYPSGNYLLQVYFYRGNDKENYLCYSCSEVVIIADNLISKKEKNIADEDFNEIFSISYDLNGGSWIDGYSPKETFSVTSENFKLPNGNNIKKPGYVFNGWHLSQIDGDANVYVHNTSILRNITYYASYIEMANDEGYGDLNFSLRFKANTNVKFVDYTLSMYQNDDSYRNTKGVKYPDAAKYKYCTSGLMKISYDESDTIAALITENSSLPAGVFSLILTIYDDYKKQNKVGTFEFLVGIQNNQIKQCEYDIKLNKPYHKITYFLYDNDNSYNPTHGYATNDVFAPLFYEEGVVTPLMDFKTDVSIVEAHYGWNKTWTCRNGGELVYNITKTSVNFARDLTFKPTY